MCTKLYNTQRKGVHRNMQEMIASLAAVVITIGSVLGGAGEAPDTKPQPTAAVYSNLYDQPTQKAVADQLMEKGVSKEQADTLVSWIEDYNSRVKAPGLPEGFVPMQGNTVEYSSVPPKEQPDGTFLSEANCRLTAFLLMRNMVETNAKNDVQDTYLLFDLEAIDGEKQFAMKAADRANYVTLFSWVKVAGEKTLEGHVSRIQKAWQERAIGIKEGAGLSLIEIYLHEPFEDVRFVGHTGVLMDTGDGLLFVEKYGPTAPFQATKLVDRQALKAYLLARPDLYGDGTELAPIVMENGKVI